MPSDKTPSADSSPPTQRVVLVLELLAAAELPQTAAQIADTLALSRSTVASVLSALHARDWVNRNPDLTYQIGPALLRAAEQHRANPARDPMHIALRKLARTVDCGVAMLETSGTEIRFIAVVENRGRIPAGISTGTRLPLIPPAAATIIAHADPDAQDAWVAAAEPEHHDRLRNLLDDIRALGAAVWGVDAHSVASLDVLADLVEHLSHDPASATLRDRVLALLGGISGDAYRPGDLEEDIELPISYMSVPVWAGESRPSAELLIGPLRSAVTLPEREHYLAALTEAAAELLPPTKH
ncbi:helix-turn-helix domain-containing protein [Nocardia sp. NPDC050378]|uniref:helix-turn-helix domain-containing protein n=1 Tax=Nocardia sp. NPDC050378 TaxID=3155400 RepID=UPI0033E90A32